ALLLSTQPFVRFRPACPGSRVPDLHRVFTMIQNSPFKIQQSDGRALASTPERCHVPPPFLMTKELTIYLDGKLVPESAAKISVFDHGLLYGDGVFEGIRFYNGRVFRLEEHTRRIYDSAKSLLLKIPMTPEEMIRATVE